MPGTKIAIKHLWLLFTLLWMGLIFVFSTDGFSSANTLGILAWGLGWLWPDFSPAGLEGLNGMIRKSAHLINYLLLFLLTVHTMDFWRGEKNKNLYYSLIFCFIYAVSDEFHQSFTAGRTMAAGDVGWDALGALMGLLIYMGMKKWQPVNEPEARQEEP